VSGDGCHGRARRRQSCRGSGVAFGRPDDDRMPVRQPQVLPGPACAPTAIRAVLAANADGDILQRYDEDLDAAFEQARQRGDVIPLVQTVKRWWFEAGAWRDPKRSGSS
jgi:uncharacterized protein DUF6247